MLKRVTGVVALIAVAAALAAGCGSSDKSSSPKEVGSATSSFGSDVTISMGDYFFNPHDVVVDAGQVNITADNTGKMPHELVLLKTDQDPGKLKTNANGEVDEGAYQSPGEIPDVAPGKSASKTIALQPGKYAIICNLPGHYKQGMYGSLTVVKKPKAGATPGLPTASTVKAGDFFFNPDALNVAAGSVKFTLANIGKAPHEFVLLKTDQDPAKLKTNANGEVDEGAYQSPGEIPDVAPGKNATKPIKLTPGKYAIICNLPGHYKAGMFGSLEAQ